MPSSVSANLSPFGGVTTFTLGGYATGFGAQMTIGRSDSGSGGPFINIYSGGITPVFIDVGDGLQTALSSGSTYYWQFSDASGSVLSGPITPTGNLQFSSDGLTTIFLRCLQSGIDNIGQLPTGIKRALVMLDMPLNSFPALPIISITPQMEEQESLGIGQNIENPILTENIMWTMPTLSRKTWRISVFAQNSETRDYYKRLCILIFEAMLPYIFTPLGQNVSHKYMIHAGQTSESKKDQIPGFYFADIMCEVTGSFNVNVQLNYPIVNKIQVNINTNATGATVLVT